MTTYKRHAFSRGFDRGNYGNAYESQDWDSWYEKQLDNVHDEELHHSKEYQEGMLLGFFSSYELNEITDEVLREDLRALRAEHPELE